MSSLMSLARLISAPISLKKPFVIFSTKIQKICFLRPSCFVFCSSPLMGKMRKEKLLVKSQENNLSLKILIKNYLCSLTGLLKVCLTIVTQSMICQQKCFFEPIDIVYDLIKENENIRCYFASDLALAYRTYYS